jgi:glycosyltransferase involved in cell wall biosynthesis
LRVAITNLELWPPSGTALYVRDLALELRRQGHEPVVISSTAGPIAEELRDHGVTVSNSFARSLAQPDVIHGHHRVPTLLALRRWPTVPAIHICHDHLLPADATPLHPNIRRHFGVSRRCVQRLLDEAALPECVGLLPNFVDTARFVPRQALPQRPRRALILSNYASDRTHVPAVAVACQQAGIALDVVGAGVGRIDSAPERLLPDYDLVFAKGKAALEAMAVGAAVVLCDFSGVGPMVTAADFDRLRELNFGFEALRDPLHPDSVAREIARYDARDAAMVRDLVHERAGLVGAVETLIGVYEMISAAGVPAGATVGRAANVGRREATSLLLHWRLHSIPIRWSQRIRRVPGAPSIYRAIQRILGRRRQSR